ncbi:MAG: choice-of-anchor L domain-containing protein [Lewinellaceae bacterium]|nr:choice-of-anchor L domain-containing protein [Lewinellaceae bacterium]
MRAQSLLLLLFIPTLFGFSNFQTPLSYSGGGGKVQVIDLQGNSGREVVFIEDAVTEVHLCQLTEGETYHLQAVAMGSCQPVLQLEGYGNAKQSIFNFVAQSSCQVLYVHSDYLKGGCSGNMYLSYSCISCVQKPPSQGNPELTPIIAFPGVPAQTLVDNVFIGGGCFDTEGITHTGAAVARGSFSSGMSSIGLNSGVILASGNVATATGPNNATGAGGSVGGGGDLDLSQAANGAPIFDASILEFDFTPTQSQITFRYVFASEEYCDYVNSTFNDVFGFFLSGPGISGPFSNNAVNIAVLPNSNIAVAINNVNHNTNSAYYVGNIPAGSPQFSDPDCAGHPIAGPPSTDDCQYDGFTVVLTAVANVIPCETYHIKLAIGDAGDAVFDSAVFLEANSFDAGGDAEVTANVPFTGTTTAYEGCTSAFFFFQRSGGNINMPLVINFTISGTATPGVDYSTLPTSVTIPAGQTFFMLPVNIIDDLIAEGTETIKITLFNPCSCTTSMAVLNIVDPPPVDVQITGGVVCQGLPIVIQPTITGGVQPMTYSWNPPSTSPVYVGFPQQSGIYTVTVTDYCGSTDTDTAQVTVYTLSAAISGTASVCQGGAPGFLNVSFTGVGPWNLTYIIDGGNAQTINGITANPYQLMVTQPGTYTIVAVTNGQCIGEGSGQGIVTEPQIDLQTAITDVACNGGADGSVDLSVSGGTGPYSYSWNNNAVTQNLDSLVAGTYSVTVEDSKGCTQEISAVVDEPAVLAAAANVLSGVDCTNPTGGAIDLNVSGGTIDYIYLWNTGDTIQDLTGLTSGNYTVTVTDANGCIQTASASIMGDTLIPTADIQVMGVVNCTNTAITLDGSASSGGSNYLYQWTANGGGLLTGDPNAPITTAEGGGTYELLVTDTLNNCFTAASVVVPEDFNTPVSDPGADQIINCLVGEVTLDGSGSTAGANIQYTWTTDTGNFTSPANVASPTADAPGIYTLVVSNSVNGCADTATVAVVTDLVDPVANAGADAVIDCFMPSIQLDGTGSSGGSEFTYLWTTADGNIVNDSTLVDPTIDQQGTYTLLVTNTINGCTSTDEVLVEDFSIDPTIQIGTPGLLTCAVTELSLDASGSDSGPEYTFDWAGLNGAVLVSGGDTPSPVVGSTGFFQLTLTNTSTGCQSVDSVEVFDNLIPPVANAGDSMTIACSLPDMQIDGSGSSSGPTISYAWVATNGGNIVSGANTAMPTINNPGTYILTVTDGDNGCMAQDTMDVVLDDNSPTAVAAAPQILNCAHPSVTINGLGSSLGANFNYAWSTQDGNILTGDGTLFPTVNQPGTYNLLVTNNTNGCTSQAAVTLGIDTLAPAAVIADPDLLTCAVTSIQLDGTLSSTGPEYTYSWSTADGNIVGDNSVPDPEVDQPGTYTLLVTNTTNGCTTSADMAVLQDILPPDANAGTTDVLTCGVTSLNLDGSGSSTGPDFSYQWTTPDGNIVSGANALDPLVDAPGFYELSVLDNANGCSSTDQVEITIDVTPPQAQIATPGILTCAVTSLTLNGGLSSGTSGLTYQWSTLDGNITGSTTAPMPTVNQPGQYQLIVTQSGNQCADTTSVTVAQNIVAPTAEAGPTFELDCGTPSLTLDGTGSSAGNFSYSWGTANGVIISGGNTLFPMVSAAGTYTLTVQDNANGCSSTDQVVVTLDANAPVSNAGPTQELTCAVTSLTLDGSGSSQGAEFTYAWSTGNGNIVQGATTTNPVVNAPGTYVLMVTNTLNSCETSSSVTITQNITPPLVEAGALATITCDDTVVSLNGGGSSTGPSYSYQWTTSNGNILSGGTSLTPQVDQPGTYTLLVTDNMNGCSASDMTTVTVDQMAPTVVIQTPGTLTCAVQQLNLSGSGSSTGAIFTYQWSTLDGNILSGATTLSPQINQPGTYTLLVHNNQNGCEASASTTVSQNTVPPTADAGATAELTCAVTSLQLNGAGSSSGANFTYLWTAGPGGAITSGATTLTPTVTEPATYTLQVLNTTNGCTSTDVVTVTEDVVQPTVIIDSPASLTCLVDQVSLDAVGSNSGAGYDLTWSAANGGHIVSTANILQPLVDAPGDYTLTILDLSNGCSSSLTVEVLQTLDPPGASAGPDFLLHCHQTTVQLQGSSPIGGSGEYVWTTSNGAFLNGANTPNPTVGTAGTYLLTVTNPANGCTSEDEVIVTESFPVDFNYVVDPPVCLGYPGFIQFGDVLGGSPPYQYSISGGFAFSGQTFYGALDAGTYDLVVRDANGCELYDEAFLAPGVDVQLDVEREVFLSLGESYEVQVFVNIDENDIETITWEPSLFLSCSDCLTPVVTPTHSIDYLVTVTTAEGCEGETRISFRVKKQANVYVPNIFSPNGDGENDVFMIFAGNQIAEVKQFEVFDRWGESVYQYAHFQPNDPAFGWDGKLRGQDVDPAVFTWYAEIEMIDGRVELFEGSVALVR